MKCSSECLLWVPFAFIQSPSGGVGKHLHSRKDGGTPKDLCLDAPSGPPSQPVWGIATPLFPTLPILLSFLNLIYVQLIQKALLPFLSAYTKQETLTLLLSLLIPHSRFAQEPVRLSSNCLLSKAGALTSPNPSPLEIGVMAVQTL